MIRGHDNDIEQRRRIRDGRAKFAMYQATRHTAAPAYPAPRSPQQTKQLRLSRFLPALVGRLFSRKVGV